MVFIQGDLEAKPNFDLTHPEMGWIGKDCGSSPSTGASHRQVLELVGFLSLSVPFPEFLKVKMLGVVSTFELLGVPLKPALGSFCACQVNEPVFRCILQIADRSVWDHNDCCCQCRTASRRDRESRMRIATGNWEGHVLGSPAKIWVWLKVKQLGLRRF